MDIVYIFVIINVNESNTDCNEKEFNTILMNLHNFVQESNSKLF